MIASAYAARCAHCGEWLDTRTYGVYQHVHGWAKNREAGTNAVAMQQRDPIWMHSHCMDEVRKHISRDQGRLPL